MNCYFPFVRVNNKLSHNRFDRQSRGISENEKQIKITRLQTTDGSVILDINCNIISTSGQCRLCGYGALQKTEKTLDFSARVRYCTSKVVSQRMIIKEVLLWNTFCKPIPFAKSISGSLR